MMSSSPKSKSQEDDPNSVLDEDSNSGSSKPGEEEEEKQQSLRVKQKGSDTSTSTTNEPSSTSAAATVVIGRPAHQSELPTVDAAAAAPPVPRREKAPKRSQFSEQFQSIPSTAKVETVVTKQPTHQSAGLPSFAAAAAAAAPPVPLRVKKPRRAGFREQFLQKLRVMLDRESQNESTIVQWSNDGNSFIIKDQTQFEADIIPTYFDNPIVFASFLSKLYRWGFNRVSSRQTGRYEFRSPTFKRLGADSAPAAAAVNSFSNAGGGTSIQVQQQQQQQPNQAASSLLQQFLAQTNQLPPPDHPLSNQTGTIADLISHIQRQRSSQQPPSIPSQQSALNHLLNMNLNLYPFQQWQHQDPTLNLLNTALSILVGSQTPSAQPYSPASDQRNAIQTLMSLSGMSSLAGTLPNTHTPPTDMSQPNNVAVQSLLMLIHRACEDERQRRNQSDATQNAIVSSIEQILCLVSGGAAALNTPLRNPTGMTVSVPDSIAFEAHQIMPSAFAGSPNFHGNPVSAILQAARSMAGGQRGEVAHQTQIAADDNDDNINDGKDEGKDDHDGRLSQRKRKCPGDDGNGE